MTTLWFFGICTLLGTALGLLIAVFAGTMYNMGYKNGRRDAEQAMENREIREIMEEAARKMGVEIQQEKQP